MDEIRGFVLQTGCRLLSGRPVIHLHGKLETGQSFLLREHRLTPHFFIRSADADRAQDAGAEALSHTDRVTFGGEPVLRVESRTPAASGVLHRRLEDALVPTYEADVRFPLRYLIDRHIRGSLSLRGPSRPGAGEGVDLIFDDPEIAPAEFIPRLSVLCLDVATDPASGQVLGIALCGCGVAEVLLPRPARRGSADKALLAGLVQRVRELDPDVLTGWNVIAEDLPVLDRLAQKVRVRLDLGRGPGGLRLQQARGPRDGARATVPGRLVLDGLQLLRGASVPMEEQSLAFAARRLLGRLPGHPPAPADDAGQRLVEASRLDAEVALEVIENLHLVELAVERSLLTGLTPDRAGANIAALDFLYLSELSRRGVVASTTARRDDGEGPVKGGHVLTPQPGLYHNVLVFDFKSLYPSLIRTFQVDPLGLVAEPDEASDLIKAPSGAAFRRQPGILPGILEGLFPMREAAKAAGQTVRSHAIKILMNSFYGVLGSPGCRYRDNRLGNAITSFGRELLLWSKAHIEQAGYRVIYGDTDSLFVLSGKHDPGQARLLGQRLCRNLNRDLAQHIRQTWWVESKLELQLDKLYLRLVLPPVRGGTAGARKRYAGLVEEADGPVVVFTGMEVVRRDWSPLARRVQRELYERLFSDQKVEDYLRQVIRDLLLGRLDGQLVYNRKVPLSDQRTSYLMTREGPEVLPGRRTPPDYEHYLQKQLRPVATPVLSLLGLSFDDLLGRSRQLSLF